MCSDRAFGVDLHPKKRKIKIFSAHVKMKDAVKLVAGLVALYVALTWSYSGYTSQSNMEDSVAARSLKTPYARP